MNEGKRGFITMFRTTRLVFSFFFFEISFGNSLRSNISRDKFDAKINIKISWDLRGRERKGGFVCVTRLAAPFLNFSTLESSIVNSFYHLSLSLSLSAVSSRLVIYL